MNRELQEMTNKELHQEYKHYTRAVEDSIPDGVNIDDVKMLNEITFEMDLREGK